MTMPESVCPFHHRKLRYPKCREACWFKYAELNPIVRHSSPATAGFDTSPSLSATPEPNEENKYSQSTFTSANLAIHCFAREPSIKVEETVSTPASLSIYPRWQNMAFKFPSAISSAAMTSATAVASKVASPTPEPDARKRATSIEGGSNCLSAKKPRIKARS